MRKLESHKIERSVIEEKTRISRDFLESALDQLDERPDLLPTVFRREIQLAAGTCATGGKNPTAALRRAARVTGLMFVHGQHQDESTFIALDEKTPVDLSGKVDMSLVNAPAWVEGLWCALAVDDHYAKQWLAAVPVSLLESQSSQHGRYALALGEFLRSLITRDGRHGQWLTQAIERCDDDDDAALNATRDWVDGIEYPALRAAFHLLDRDEAGFNQALAELHEQHRQYWQSSENRLAVDGLLSLRGCALRRLADGLGVKVEVDSDYIPSAVWQSPPSAHRVHCPYCVSALAISAPTCGLCGRKISDAPLELSSAATKEKRRPCEACDFPLHTLAVICPRCRTPRRAK